MELENNDKQELALAGELDIASRWSRLWASLIDGIIMLIVFLPVIFLTGGYAHALEGIQPSIGYTLGMGALSIAVFVLIQGKFLSKSGQTIGKKALGIKIVTLSGELPSVKDHLIKRYGVYLIIGQIPVVGSLLSIVNILFIFGKDKRCVHDLIAGTSVVNC